MADVIEVERDVFERLVARVVELEEAQRRHVDTHRRARIVGADVFGEEPVVRPNVFYDRRAD